MRKDFLKTILRALDDHLTTSLYEKGARTKQTYEQSVNFIRRHLSYSIITLKFTLGLHNSHPLKLHLGCGDQYIDGYVNIDLRKTTATDFVCRIENLPYPNDSAEIIELYHVIEHLPRHDLPAAMREWYRVLSPGGKLIIECPDFDAAAKEYVAGNEERLDNIFGLQRFPGDVHFFGYNFRRLKNLLEDAGFVAIEQREPRDYHTKDEPCLRVEASKEQ